MTTGHPRTTEVVDGVPIKIWTTETDIKTMEQAVNLAQLPFAFKWIALMPDAHVGYGMPIGGVLATRGAIIPNAVGVDIGCGMLAVRTSLDGIELDDLKKVIGLIRERVPVGFNWHEEPQDDTMPPLDGEPIVHREEDKAARQLGTLGGGNHFIEVQRGDDGRIWLMIHSGSRNLGLQVAKHYNNLAVSLNERWCSRVPKAWELAFLPIDTEEAKSYRREMDYCVRFALANREHMMGVCIAAMREIVGSLEEDDPINIAHNYASMEHHMGQNVMVHRKGATSAREGELGIIPGSQGTASYIVRGLGNVQSFRSCSHGAGRTMGRKQAIRELDLDEQVRSMDERGILHSIRGAKDLDEAPGAYKDIDEVMAAQSDLVEIVTRLEPLAVVKG